MYRSMIMMDPPEHDRLRALVSRVFTPRAVSALEPMIREVITSFLSAFDDADSFDAVADFSALFPVEIISRMLGSPKVSASRSATGWTSACTASRARWTPPPRAPRP